MKKSETFILVEKCKADEGYCMACNRDYWDEYIYKFNLGGFKARLCNKCIERLKRGFKRNANKNHQKQKNPD